MKFVPIFLSFLFFLSAADLFAKSRSPWVQKQFSIAGDQACTRGRFDGGLITPSKMRFVAYSAKPVNIQVRTINGRKLKGTYGPSKMINISFVAMQPFELLICRVYQPPKAAPQGQQARNFGPRLDVYLSSN